MKIQPLSIKPHADGKSSEHFWSFTEKRCCIISQTTAVDQKQQLKKHKTCPHL